MTTKAQQWEEVQAVVEAAYPGLSKKEKQQKAVSVHRKGNRDHVAFRALGVLAERNAQSPLVEVVPEVPVHTTAELLAVVKEAYPDKKAAEQRKLATEMKGDPSSFVRLQEMAKRKNAALAAQKSMLRKFTTPTSAKKTLAGHAALSWSLIIFCVTQLDYKVWSVFSTSLCDAVSSAVVAAGIAICRRAVVESEAATTAAYAASLVAAMVTRLSRSFQPPLPSPLFYICKIPELSALLSSSSLYRTEEVDFVKAVQDWNEDVENLGVDVVRYRRSFAGNALSSTTVQTAIHEHSLEIEEIVRDFHFTPLSSSASSFERSERSELARRWLSDKTQAIRALHNASLSLQSKLQRNLQQRQSRTRAEPPAKCDPTICVPSHQIKWDACLRQCSSGVNMHVPGMDEEQLYEILLLVRHNGFISLDEEIKQKRSWRRDTLLKARAICNVAPVAVVCQEDAILLCDMEQTEWPSIEDGHSEEQKDEEEEDPFPADTIADIAVQAVDGPPPARGRKKVTAQHPLLVSTIQDLLSQQTVTAQNRRRDDSGCVGITASEICAHLKTQNIKVHISTVRRLFKAPNPRTRSASQYSNLFNVRLSSHMDTEQEEHIDAHHCASQVRLLVEAAVHCNADGEEVGLLSADTKSVVPLGCLAVSKHIRRTSYLLQRHQVPDHSFITGSNVKPVVFMWLDTVGKAAVREMDGAGREHLPYPRNGPMRIFLRSSRYSFFSPFSQHHL